MRNSNLASILNKLDETAILLKEGEMLEVRGGSGNCSNGTCGNTSCNGGCCSNGACNNSTCNGGCR